MHSFFKIISHKYSVFPDAASARQDIFVAADAAVDLVCMTIFSLFTQSGSASNWRLMAAHWIRPSASCFPQIRIGKSADTTDWKIGVLSYLITEFQETSRFTKIWMVFRWDGILKIRMVCECDMEACNACFSSIGTNTFSSSSITPAFP